VVQTNKVQPLGKYRVWGAKKQGWGKQLEILPKHYPQKEKKTGNSWVLNCSHQKENVKGGQKKANMSHVSNFRFHPIAPKGTGKKKKTGQNWEKKF